MAKTKAAKKGSWIVRMTATIEKDVVCNDCTEEQARTDPFKFAISEQEMSQIDYKVEEVHPNE